MPERDSELAYTFSFARSAMESLQALPVAAQQTLPEVIAALAEDPGKYADRIRPVPGRPGAYVYSHPDPALEATYELDAGRKNIGFVHFAAPVLKEQKPIFVSYCHKDDVWRERLLAWLAALVQEGDVDIWHDQRIAASSKWKQDIDEALNTARAAILLVTPDFMASEFISEKELPPLLAAAESGRLKLFLIAVSSCYLGKSPLKAFQWANDPDRPLDMLRKGERNKVGAEITGKIAQALEAERPGR